MKRFFASPVGTFIVSIIGATIVAVLNFTVRWEKRDRHHYLHLRKESPPPIMVCWHDQLIAFPAILGLGAPCSCLCSPHSDGRHIGHILRRFGFRAVWGSSNRQPVAGLRAMAREINEGRIAVISPDGPRGPAHVMAIGPIALAHLTGAPILPVAWRGHREWRAGGWDRMRFMKPFSSAAIVYGEPIFLEKTKDKDGLEQQRVLIEDALNALNFQLAGEFDSAD